MGSIQKHLKSSAGPMQDRKEAREAALEDQMNSELIQKRVETWFHLSAIPVYNKECDATFRHYGLYSYEQICDALSLEPLQDNY